MTSDQQFILALIAAISTALGGLVAVFVQIRQLKLHLNSKMDKLLELTAKSSRAEGVLEGRRSTDPHYLPTSGPPP